MKLSTLVAASCIGAAYSKQCFGYTPMSSISTYLGADINYETSNRICCNNHRFAEYSGYLDAPEVDLFGRLDPSNETVFYDSVCGLPLFIAPRGRSFDDFKKESLHHGWPSFRPEEIISDNVIIHNDGRIESRCLTHLGHNLPEGGVDRYCIDLVCISGQPLSLDDDRTKILTFLDATVIYPEEFNATSYESSAESFSGKYNDGSAFVTIALSVGAAVLAIPFCSFVMKLMLIMKKEE
jgi:peptide methionine sulfoxide reductase MsrB